jgi:hypothetical protein
VGPSNANIARQNDPREEGVTAGCRCQCSFQKLVLSLYVDIRKPVQNDGLELPFAELRQQGLDVLCRCKMHLLLLLLCTIIALLYVSLQTGVLVFAGHHKKEAAVVVPITEEVRVDAVPLLWIGIQELETGRLCGPLRRVLAGGQTTKEIHAHPKAKRPPKVVVVHPGDIVLGAVLQYGVL